MRYISISVCHVLLLLGLWQTHAAADVSDDVEKAKIMFESATADQRSGKWSDALDKLEYVASVKETAGVRFHMAVCQEALGMLTKSLESFERAQSIARETNSADVLRLVSSEIERLRAVVPSIAVEAPAKYQALVVQIGKEAKRKYVPSTPIYLDAGSHDVVVEVDGVERLNSTVTLREGQREKLRVREDRIPVAESSTFATPTLKSSDTFVYRSKNAKPSPSGSSWASDVPVGSWVSFGAGAAFCVGGIFSILKADDVASQFASECTRGQCDTKRFTSVRRWDGAAYGMWAASALAVGTGVALIVIRDKSGESTTLSVSPSRVHLEKTF